MIRRKQESIFEPGKWIYIFCNQKYIPDQSYWQTHDQVKAIFLNFFLVMESLKWEAETSLCWNPSSCPFLRHLVDLDVLLFRGFNLEHANLFLCLVYTQRPMKIEWMIKRFSKAMSFALLGNKLSSSQASKIHKKFHFRWKKFLLSL